MDTLSKRFWIFIGLLLLVIGGFLGFNNLYKSAGSKTDTATNNNANTKLMMSLESFKGFHHDAEILLEKLTTLKAGLESAIDTKDIKLLASTINNTYRIMDNVSANRIPTIAPFEICDEALNSLGVYAVASKNYYSGSKKIDISQINRMKNTFNTQFAQCQSIVNDKPVEVLYQDYQ